MEHGNGIARMDGEFDQDVMNQSEQAGTSTDFVARQSVFQSEEVHKDLAEECSRPRRARNATERYNDYVETEKAINEGYDDCEIVWKYE